MHYRTALRCQQWKRFKTNTTQNSTELNNHPRMKFLAQGCLSLKPCRNCHFNIKLRAIQHYRLYVWGFSFLSLTPEGGNSSIPTDKLGETCRKSPAWEFCRAVIQAFHLFLTLRCSSHSIPADDVFWSPFCQSFSHFIPLSQYGHTIDFFLYLYNH